MACVCVCVCGHMHAHAQVLYWLNMDVEIWRSKHTIKKHLFYSDISYPVNSNFMGETEEKDLIQSKGKKIGDFHLVIRQNLAL